VNKIEDFTMKLFSFFLLPVMLISTAASASPLKQSDPVQMRCPQPQTISYANYIYTAPVTLPGWEGSWNSQPHREQSVERFVNALYFAKNDVKEGVLVNCTYALANGMQIDLAYSRKGEEKVLSNLIVSIEGNANWTPESSSATERFYDCDSSTEACGFKAIKTVYQ